MWIGIKWLAPVDKLWMTFYGFFHRESCSQ